MRAKLTNPQYHECVQLISDEPSAVYVVKLDGEVYTLRGPKMRGFLMPSDIIDEFWRF